MALSRIARRSYHVVVPYSVRLRLWALRHQTHSTEPTQEAAEVTGVVPLLSANTTGVENANAASVPELDDDLFSDDTALPSWSPEGDKPLLVRNSSDLCTLVQQANALSVDDRAELVSQLIVPFIGDGSWREHFSTWEQAGFHVSPNHFYQPFPDTGDLRMALWETDSDLPGIDMNVPGQIDFLQNVCLRYSAEYSAFAKHRSDDPRQFYLENTSLTGLDASVLHCMVRHYQPKRIIEVGSGMSSLVIAHAAQLNGNVPEYTVIDPYPNETLRAGVPGITTLVSKKVQEVDRGLFSTLEHGDILFIDTSHVVKTGGDVNTLFLDILPRTRNGVIVHVHDIFFPQEYPRSWLVDLRYYWTEQYLLQAFLCYNAKFQVQFASHYMSRTCPELVASFPMFPYTAVGGGSIWMRRIAE